MGERRGEVEGEMEWKKGRIEWRDVDEEEDAEWGASLWIDDGLEGMLM